MKNFVSPHVHVNSLDSASTPKAFIEKEKALGTGAITVTDHGTLQACRSVYDQAKEHDLVPIIGLEGYLRDDDCPILTAAGIEKKHPLKKDKSPDTSKPASFAHHLKYMHFTAHFMDQAAFNVGVKLLSKAPVERHGSELKPLFNWADLEELGGQNVTFGSGCLIGVVQRHMMQHDDVATAIKYYEKFRSLVRPGNFYVEVFPHVCDHKWEQGVFVTINTGDGLRERRFHERKKLKTNVGEIEAAELAKAFAKKDNEHEFLVAIRDYRTWEEFEPVRIHRVEKREGFILNECRPWAKDGDVQRGCNELVMRLARRYGDKILISDDAHFASPEYKIVQDMRLRQSGNWQFHTSYHRLSSEDAYKYFDAKFNVSKPEFEEWVENSHEWREKFRDFSFKNEVSLPKKFYPENTLGHLQTLINKHGRMDWSDARRVERLKAEIDLFKFNGKVDLLPYFFLAEEVCSQYEANDMLVGPGRGSAAGCSIAYLLGITHADPLRHGLSLERFLTLDRINAGAFPDIDMDFQSRDILVDEPDGWLHKRFGDHCAQISTETLLRLKSSARDVARAEFGSIPYEMDQLIRKFEEAPQGVMDQDFVFGYEDSDTWKLGSIEYDKALIAYTQQYPRQWEVVRKTLALSRSKGRHASAFVIADKPIPELGIPLMTIGGVRCTAYTMQAVEACGGIKMDFLIINALNDISHAIRLIQKKNEPLDRDVQIDGLRVPRVRVLPHADALYDIWDLPPDQGVYDDVALGVTETVFQFNTSGAIKWLDRFRGIRPDGKRMISSLEDLAIFTALDRRGPLDMEVANPEREGTTHNLLVEYARRARGQAGSPDILPVFEKLLPETYGVMVYQEQLQAMYQQLTGCSGSDAESFRRQVAKKKMEKVLKLYPSFIESAGAKIGEENAKAAWEFMKTWASYGFNRSHAICYAIIGYACAFLKHHYPLEWWTAVLSNATKEEVNIKFWRHAGHLIDLPNVSKSGATFEIRGDRIQAPVSLLHGIGEAAHKELMAGMPYRDIEDFCRKIQAHRERTGSVETVEVVKEKRKKDRKTGEVTVTTWTEPVVKKKLGRSALNSKIVSTLIISGAMDSLFPPGTSVLQMLEAYVTTLEAVTCEAAGKPNKRKEKVPEKYLNISSLDRYQMRKAVLPAYSEALLPLLAGAQVEGVFEGPEGWYLKRGNFQVRLESGEGMERIERLSSSITEMAVAGYVEDIRDFNYGEHKQREARALTLDLDGIRREFVRWPGKDKDKLPARIKELSCKGAIVIAFLSRYRGDKPFALDEVEVIRHPLSQNTETEDKNESVAEAVG